MPPTRASSTVSLLVALPEDLSKSLLVVYRPHRFSRVFKNPWGPLRLTPLFQMSQFCSDTIRKKRELWEKGVANNVNWDRSIGDPEG